MNELEILEAYILAQRDKVSERLNTAYLMRHPEGMMSAYDIVLKKIKEMKGERDGVEIQ